MSEDPQPEPLDSTETTAVITPEDLAKIPEAVRPQVEMLMHRVEMIRSPLLPPELLQRYDNVIPGLAEKLVRWTEEESEHRRGLERSSLETERTFRNRGQFIGLGVAIFGLGAAAGVAISTNSIAGTIAAGVIAIVGVGGPFAARVLAARWGRPAESSEDS